MQTMAIRTVTNSLPENEVILLTLLISKRYIPYTDLHKKAGAQGAQLRGAIHVVRKLPGFLGCSTRFGRLRRVPCGGRPVPLRHRAP